MAEMYQNFEAELRPRRHSNTSVSLPIFGNLDNAEVAVKSNKVLACAGYSVYCTILFCPSINQSEQANNDEDLDFRVY